MTEPATSSSAVHAPLAHSPRGVQKLMARMERNSFWQRLGTFLLWGLIGLAVFLGVLTYLALSGATPFAIHIDMAPTLLYVNLVPLSLLALILLGRLAKAWLELRQRRAASRLHSRLALVFSLIAAIPAIIVAIFSVTFFQMGVETWFSDRVRRAVEESFVVAKAYLNEHKQVIRADGLAMANDLNRLGPLLIDNQREFSELVATQAAIRALTEAIVFNSKGDVIARSGLSFALEFDPIPQSALDRVNQGEVSVLTSDNDDKVRALLKLDRLPDLYLYVGRQIDARVLGHIERASKAVSAYKALEGSRTSLEYSFAMIFLVVALLLLVAAILLGLTLASRLTNPISELIEAAEKIRQGDLSVRVKDTEEHELISLSRAFNRMTDQLETQRLQLVETNRQLDQRRQFSEAVLSGVPAGVMGLDAEGRIQFPNKLALEMLGLELPNCLGQRIDELVPELAPHFQTAFAKAHEKAGQHYESQIRLTKPQSRTVLLRIVSEKIGKKVSGFVVTLDDISELLSAQRMAAWADVARRLAHEIKNPLTPIRLAAERLKRKYAGQLSDDQEGFGNLIDTITRRVDDIGQMVNEFSSFARMPAPVVELIDVKALIKDFVFFYQSANHEVKFIWEEPAAEISLLADARQLRQALTNLVQNALDALREHEVKTPQIMLSLEEKGDHVMITIKDNGPGFPPEHIGQLTEPYMTTRSNGTGLGLAIVKKIMEDHGGKLQLDNDDAGGAKAVLHFDKKKIDKDLQKKG